MKKWMKQYIMALVAVFLIGNGWMTIASAEEKIPGLQEGTLSAIMIEQKTGKPNFGPIPLRVVSVELLFRACLMS